MIRFLLETVVKAVLLKLYSAMRVRSPKEKDKWQKSK